MLPSLVMLTLLLAPARIAPPPAPAGYPTPRAAGFHHCALIYDRPQRGAADLAPYVARTDAGRARESLFDAFLFLIQESGRGVRTEYGLTERVDWEYQLDRWFAPGRDLAALDDAIDRAAKDLGQPAARQVILSIPYPNPGVRAFADVDGDGKPEDLATPQGRRAVFSWYTAEARRRFNAAHYRHLALWGFYWMREDMDGGDQDRIAEAAAVVHAGGGRLLWIPWWCAPGWDKWREAGIDVAVMQPNYAFWSSGHNGRVRRNRLAVDADLTRAAGMGVEMEAGEAIASEEDRRAFLHYLADGAPGRLGYQAGAQAWYLGTDLVERSSSSADPRARAVYAALADYVAGRAVPDPDPSLVLKWHHSRGERIGEGRLARPSWIGDVEVSLDEPGKAWRGTVQVELQSPGSRSWSGGGWAIRASADAGDGRHQMLVVPVGQRAQALRVTLRSQDPRTTPPTGAVGVNPAGEHAVRRHLALGCSYRVSPGWPAAYGDDGTKLTDGVVPERGFTTGKMVGWYGADAAVTFDLGRVVPIDRIEVCCSGGSAAAINWPRNGAVLLSETGSLPSASSAPGRMPAGLTWLSPDPVVIDRTRSQTDLDGRLVFRAASKRARYVTVLLGADGWLMLSEVRIWAGGRNVATGAPYALSPPPTPRASEEPSYPDDGRKLTDGVVAADFTSPRVVGWSDDAERTVEVDLGSVKPVHEVEVWSLYGGLYGIHALARVSVDTSPDGANWVVLGTQSPSCTENGKSCQALPLRVSAAAPIKVRWVRVRARRSQGWAMLSEIEVR